MEIKKDYKAMMCSDGLCARQIINTSFCFNVIILLSLYNYLLILQIGNRAVKGAVQGHTATTAELKGNFVSTPSSTLFLTLLHYWAFLQGKGFQRERGPAVVNIPKWSKTMKARLELRVMTFSVTFSGTGA